jgi:hypothetical protein
MLSKAQWKDKPSKIMCPKFSKHDTYNLGNGNEYRLKSRSNTWLKDLLGTKIKLYSL